MRLAMTVAAMLAGTPLAAQQFTTAAEVRPILEATRMNWIAVREYDGQDLVYFTHLIAWRCGLTRVHFSINTAETVYDWPLEPCYEGTAAPNAMVAAEYLPYVALPPGSAQNLAVVLEMDDGTVLSGGFTRAQVLMP